MRDLKVIGERVAFTGSRISVVEREFIDRNGKKGTYEVVRSNCGKYVVNVLAVTPDRSVVLVSQQRICLTHDDISDIADKYCVRTLELPGGCLGNDLIPDVFKKVIEVAHQELREETGYRVLPGTDVRMLADHVPCDVGRYETETVLLLAQVEKVGEPSLEDSETLEVVTVPVSTFPEFLCRKRYVDARVWTAYGIAKQCGLI